MDIESLRLFLDVWKSGNITSAANNHYITQSALSRRLALLEKELGIQLFQRGKGKTQAIITPEGEAFSDIAERMLLLYGQAMELKRDVKRQFLTVACIRSAQDYLLPRFILQMEKEHPNLCVTLEDHHSYQIFSLLENRRVDIGIAQSPAPFPDLKSEFLYEEGYRVVMQADSAGLGIFAKGKALRPERLPAGHEIYQTFDSEFSDWHAQWRRPFDAKICVNTTPTAVRYFHDREDWMIVPDAVAYSLKERGFVSYPLTVQTPRHRVFIIYSKRAQDSLINSFADEAKRYFAEFSQKS